MAIIQVQDLSKRFVIQHQKGGGVGKYTALRDVITDKLKFNKEKQDTSIEEFWALQNVSFDIEKGDRVGIIGRNGAGKSTLLKILSRITEPSSGSVRIKGRLASLLEVGTGFHQELTGRENIYLNGSILGMSRGEIKSKFDEIVDFAEVEKFLDTPVKRYSSGMYVRLAFAVAAHLEPEILVIDEVLAVGDAQFQRKCLGKMEDVSRNNGRTILFVSHNMAAVQAICNKGIFLERGNLVGTGDIQSQIKDYFNTFGNRNIALDTIIGSFRLVDMKLNSDRVQSLSEMSLSVILEAIDDDLLQSLVLLVYSKEGIRLAIVDFRRECNNRKVKKGQLLTLNTVLHSIPFIEGSYDLGLFYQGSRGAVNAFSLMTVNVLANESETIPYDVSVRGVMELNSDFTVQIT